jgi:DNA-binding NtrC family response regulator
MKILLVDDDLSVLESTKRILEYSHHEVITAHSGSEALTILKHDSIEAVITDVRMPGMTGMDFFEQSKKAGIQTPFIIMTAFGQVQDAVWAMKMGAVDFLLKPFKREQLLQAIKGIQTLPIKVETKTQAGWVGSSPAMQELRMLVEQIARTDASVLITGESGSGKEQVARKIHELGRTKNGQFVAINCAAMPEALIESELFGHVKGAFTGANTAKKGLIAEADQGTLFLDEIGDLPLSLQPKLLRVLENGTIRPVGSNSEVPVQVRVLAASHHRLQDQVARGLFREDLFFRLDVISISVPPLRDRIEDIPELANHFLTSLSEAYGKPVYGFAEGVMDCLCAHSYPGNVRELRNVIERMITLCEGQTIQLSDLPPHFLGASLKPVLPASASDTANSDAAKNSLHIPIGMSLKEVESLLIERALEYTAGDRASAAALLGVSERTIHRRVHSKTIE